MDGDFVKGIALVKASKYRFKILKAIGNEIVTPSEISKEIAIRLNHVSMFLREMKVNKLVECLNEESRKGRLYRLTRLGKQVINYKNESKSR